MNCIDEQLLQKYIDGESTDSEKVAVKQHFSACPICLQKHAEMEKLSSELKKAINSITTEKTTIPTFKIPENKSEKNIKLFIVSFSAACILFFVLFLANQQTEKHQKEIIIVQSIPREVDANRPASEQEFVIEVFDGRGTRSEYIIE
jgi:flagellar basal body-associated protein FliL